VTKIGRVVQAPPMFGKGDEFVIPATGQTGTLTGDPFFWQDTADPGWYADAIINEEPTTVFVECIRMAGG